MVKFLVILFWILLTVNLDKLQCCMHGVFLGTFRFVGLYKKVLYHRVEGSSLYQNQLSVNSEKFSFSRYTT